MPGNPEVRVAAGPRPAPVAFSSTQRVLGVDPSLTSTGYAVLEGDERDCTALAHGAIRTTARAERPARLLAIHDELLSLIREWAPSAVAVESPFVSENVQSAMAIGEVRAVVLLAAAASGLPALEYPPAEIKQTVAGYGRSDKTQVHEMVMRQVTVNEGFASTDAADAAAVALCHLIRARRERLVAEQAR
jgi:crossover junction endodeoxyribonuclease RuvC